METTFFYKNLSKNEEKAFVEYVNLKVHAIEQLLTTFSQDGVILRASMEKFEKHDAFEVEFCLSLQGKQLMATEASHQVSKAVDLSKDRLVAQIKKFISALRKERSHQSLRGSKTKIANLLSVSEEVI